MHAFTATHTVDLSHKSDLKSKMQKKTDIMILPVESAKASYVFQVVWTESKAINKGWLWGQGGRELAVAVTVTGTLGATEKV